MTRTTLSKKVRFGVFKRDSFTCRYCGASAPDVLLQVDHITPVAEGGTDDPENLATACTACNIGKGAEPLSAVSAPTHVRDLSAPDGTADDPTATPGERRRAQAAELGERRLQLEMLLAWREGIMRLRDDAIEAVDRRLVVRTGMAMDEERRQIMRQWMRHYGLSEIFEALEDALDQLLEWQDGVVTAASWERAFTAIPRVAQLQRTMRDEPNIRELLDIQGLLRQRLQNMNELRCRRLLMDAIEVGADIGSLKAFAGGVKSWSDFRDGIEAYIADYAEAPPRARNPKAAARDCKDNAGPDPRPDGLRPLGPAARPAPIDWSEAGRAHRPAARAEHVPGTGALVEPEGPRVGEGRSAHDAG